MVEAVLVIIVLGLFVEEQRRICAQDNTVRKLLIPAAWFVLSIMICIYVKVGVEGHESRPVSFSGDPKAVIVQTEETDEERSYSILRDSEEVASITFSNAEYDHHYLLKTFLLFNIPTLLFVMFIFTGKVSKTVNREQ